MFTKKLPLQNSPKLILRTILGATSNMRLFKIQADETELNTLQGIKTIYIP